MENRLLKIVLISLFLINLILALILFLPIISQPKITVINHNPSYLIKYAPTQQFITYLKNHSLLTGPGITDSHYNLNIYIEKDIPVNPTYRLVSDPNKLETSPIMFAGSIKRDKNQKNIQIYINSTVQKNLKEIDTSQTITAIILNLLIKDRRNVKGRFPTELRTLGKTVDNWRQQLKKLPFTAEYH